MMRAKRFGLVLMLMSVTACAPVVYEATYREPAGHASVYSTYSQPSYYYEPVYQRIHSIEVTLYADNTYLGVYFQPIHLVIADGEYVEIPIRNRRGRHRKIYAHYHQNNLHFDADRNCRKIHGSSRYKYDQRWDKGHKYSRINLGNDYDLTGLRLEIRKAPNGRRQKSPTDRHAAKVSGFYTAKKHYNNGKVLIKQNKSSKKAPERAIKTVKKPVQRVSGKRIKYTDKKQFVVRKLQKKSITTNIRQKNRSTSKDRRPDVVVETTEKLRKATIRDRQTVVQAQRSRSDRKSIKASRSAKKTEMRDHASRNKSVKISLAGGTVTINGKQGKFRKTSLTLKEGESRNVTLIAKNGHKIIVPISYHNGTLRVTRNGKQFKSDTSWSKGRTYKIDTKGVSRLNNVRLTVVSP